MRDGEKLDTCLFKPSSGEPPWPCLLIQSPYRFKGSFLEELLPLTEEGYVIVFQRTRKSNLGLLDLFMNMKKSRNDTFDTCSWLVNRHFCNGLIGMWGVSASAILQTLIGGQDIPGLKALYTISSTCRLIRDTIFWGDVIRKDLIQDRISPSIQALLGICSFQESSPLFRMIEPSRYITSKQPPTLYCTGWYDFFSRGTIESFLEHQRIASSQSVLIIGPWSHLPMKEVFSLFPNENDLPFDCSPNKWFNSFLKGEPWNEKIFSIYYVIHPQGEGGGWKKLETWPVPTQDKYIPFKIESDFTLNIKHDPLHPVPTIGGWNLHVPSGPIHQQEMRSHLSVQEIVLDFETKEEMTITGIPQLHLSFLYTEQTSCIVRLCSISPQDEWTPVSQGTKKLTKLVSHYVIDCSPISFLLKPGERLGLLFSSSSDPSLQHMNVPTSVLLDCSNSQIILPVETTT